MQDFTKQNMTKLNVSKKPETLTKQPNWLTKNRFWNLAFLFLIPVEIHLAILFDNSIPIALAIITAIAIFGFAPKDPNSITKEEAMNNPYAGAATLILVVSFFFMQFCGDDLFKIFGIKFRDIDNSLYTFFIFLTPILILCYANIPLSSCFKADENYKPKHHVHTMQSSHSKIVAANNQRSSDLRNMPSNSYYPGNIYHNRR